MGLVNGGLNGRRFRIPAALPEGFRDLYLEQIRANAFVDCDNAADTEPRIGWVDVFDPANSTFELNTFLYDRYLVLSLRSDVKKIQGTYLKIATARKFAEVCAERNLEKLTKTEQEILSEALEGELLRRALPTVSTTDVAWDIQTGQIIVFGSSETTLEQVRQLVRDTFDLSLRPERMVDWLTDKLTMEEVIQRAGTLPGGASSGEDPLAGNEFVLGSDFLTWLWLQSESSDGRFRALDGSNVKEAALAKLVPDSDDEEDFNEVTESLKHADLNLWIDSRLKLRELTDKDPSTTILMGLSPSTTPEARQNLHGGKRPVEAQLGLKLNDLECSMVVEAHPEGLRVGALKIPFEVKTGKDEKLFERMMLLDLIHTTVEQLFQQFFLDRTSPAWQEKVDRWLAEELAAK